MKYLDCPPLFVGSLHYSVDFLILFSKKYLLRSIFHCSRLRVTIVIQELPSAITDAVKFTALNAI